MNFTSVAVTTETLLSNGTSFVAETDNGSNEIDAPLSTEIHLGLKNAAKRKREFK